MELSQQNSHSPYQLLLQAFLLIPIYHYFIGTVILIVIFWYNFLECHLIRDILTGFRGQSVTFTFNSESKIYQEVVSKCQILHGRYLVTPWLASPHLQTIFLSYYGRPPVFKYRRQIFRTTDGGTIALDWLMSSDVCGEVVYTDKSKDDRTPIVVVLPGLTSESNATYLRHLAYNIAKSGWNVVVSNHRGLGGVPLTSEVFYDAARTDDIRAVVRHLHCEYPNAPLFAIGTSIGANVLVKYLGEDGEDIPIAGAATVCSPYDLLLCDRSLARGVLQKMYDKTIAGGLQAFAQLHDAYTRLANMEGVKKARRIRDFDKNATVIVGNHMTPDTYYRRSTSANYIYNVGVPLLCISALDDPICTREAIPWDECRLNKNVVLATTQHGGHLAYFEGLTASSLWWVRAVNEYLTILHSSPYTHEPHKISGLNQPSKPSINQQVPYVNVAQNGKVANGGNDSTRADLVEGSSELHKQAG